MSPRRRETTEVHGIGSRTWIIRGIATVTGALLIWLLSGTIRRIDRLEDKLDNLKDRVVALEKHGHTQDPAIDKLERRIDRLERPRPWERERR